MSIRCVCRESDEERRQNGVEEQRFLRLSSAEGRRMGELARYKDRLGLCLFRMAHGGEGYLE